MKLAKGWWNTPRPMRHLVETGNASISIHTQTRSGRGGGRPHRSLGAGPSRQGAGPNFSWRWTMIDPLRVPRFRRQHWPSNWGSVPSGVDQHARQWNPNAVVERSGKLDMPGPPGIADRQKCTILQAGWWLFSAVQAESTVREMTTSLSAQRRRGIHAVLQDAAGAGHVGGARAWTRTGTRTSSARWRP